MKEDRQDESEAREESAVAVVVAAEKVDEEAHEGVGEAERGSSRFRFRLRSPRWVTAAAAAAAAFAAAVPAAAAKCGAAGSSATEGRAFPSTADREKLRCQAGRKSARVPLPPPYALLLRIPLLLLLLTFSA